MSSTIYVNRPGGVLAKYRDGSVHQLTYGQEVPVDELAEHVDPRGWADGRQRLAAPSQELEAHRRAALAEGGQVNSSSSPVPGNYNELDEDTAARFMQQLGRYPESQVSVLRHEILFGGNRQKVLDAAGEYARQAVALQMAATPKASVANEVPSSEGTPVVSIGDPQLAADDAVDQIQKRALAGLRGKTPPPSGDAGAEVQALRDEVAQLKADAASRRNDGSSNDGSPAVGWSAFNKAQLVAYVKQHELPVDPDQNKEPLLKEIQNVEGHEQPQTPPDPDAK